MSGMAFGRQRKRGRAPAQQPKVDKAAVAVVEEDAPASPAAAAAVTDATEHAHPVSPFASGVYVDPIIKVGAEIPASESLYFPAQRQF